MRGETAGIAVSGRGAPVPTAEIIPIDAADVSVRSRSSSIQPPAYVSPVLVRRTQVVVAPSRSATKTSPSFDMPPAARSVAARRREFGAHSIATGRQRAASSSAGTVIVVRPRSTRMTCTFPSAAHATAFPSGDHRVRSTSAFFDAVAIGNRRFPSRSLTHSSRSSPGEGRQYARRPAVESCGGAIAAEAVGSRKARTSRVLTLIATTERPTMATDASACGSIGGSRLMPPLHRPRPVVPGRSLLPRYRPVDQRDEGVVDARAARDEHRAVRAYAGRVAEPAARFGHEEPSRGPVPGVPACLCVRIDPAGRHEREIERRGAQPPHVADVREHRRFAPRLLAPLVRVVRESRRDERERDVGRRRDHQPPVRGRVAGPQPCAPTSDREEELALDGILHDADERPLGVHAPDAHGPLRDPVEVVDRAVERIDEPPATRATRRATAFLGHDLVVGIRRADRLDDEALRRTVGVADLVGRAALERAPADQHLPAPHELVARAPGHVDRGAKEIGRRVPGRRGHSCVTRPGLTGASAPFACTYAATTSTSSSPYITFVPFAKPVWPSPPPRRYS